MAIQPYDDLRNLSIVQQHEIGHTLGLGHFKSYSPMNPSIFEWMAESRHNAVAAQALTSAAELDRPTPLLPFARTTKWVSADDYDRQLEALFRELTRRAPVLPLELDRVVGPEGAIDSMRQGGFVQLKVADRIRSLAPGESRRP